MKFGRLASRIDFQLTLIAVLTLALVPAVANEKGDAKKGKAIFESLTCIDCHLGGENSLKPSKPIKGEKFAKKYKKDIQIEQVIRKGVYGSGMPAFGKDIISDAQLIDLIAYIRSLTPTESKKGAPDKKAK